VSIAYQVVGEGEIDLVLVPGFVSHVEVAWEEPRLARFLTRLASFSRLIVFDKRGTGMSDPVDNPPSIDERMDDIGAVMDAVGSTRAAIFGVSEGGTLSLLFGEAHPERARAVVLYGSWSRRLVGPDYPYGPTPEELEAVVDGMARSWASGRPKIRTSAVRCRARRWTASTSATSPAAAPISSFRPRRNSRTCTQPDWRNSWCRTTDPRSSAWTRSGT